MPNSSKRSSQKMPSEAEMISNSETLNRAIAANKRRLLIQSITNSLVMKFIATGFLLAALFTATFLIAYQYIQKKQTEDALKEIPNAEVTVPNIVEYVNATPSLTQTVTPTGTQGRFCGGIAAIECPTGYQCKLDGNYPDAGGQCVVEGAEIIDKESPMAP